MGTGSGSEPTVDSLTAELAATKSQMKAMVEMIQRDAMTRQILEPLVDLVNIWRDRTTVLEKDAPVENVVVEFTDITARLMGLHAEWAYEQRERHNLNDTSDASR